ncbi:hypothetical protein D3C79_840100 [compost metagenome]
MYRILHIVPVRRSIVGNLIIIQRLQYSLAIVVKRLRHVIMEDNIRCIVGCKQLFKICNFPGTSNRYKINLHVVFVAKLLLNIFRVVIVRYVPAFIRTFIHRNIQADLFRESLRIIRESARLCAHACIGTRAIACCWRRPICCTAIVIAGATGHKSGSHGYCHQHRKKFLFTAHRLSPCYIHSFSTYPLLESYSFTAPSMAP